MTHAVLSMSCRAGCDSLGSRSERLRNARANQLPKQQLLADGSVFLIRLLQLWMVHSNQAARHPPANAAYHTLAGEEEEEGVEEEQRQENRQEDRKQRRLNKKRKKGNVKKWKRKGEERRVEEKRGEARRGVRLL